MPTAIVVGDFNEDGIEDLAVANAVHDLESPLGDLYILLGNGNGTFGCDANFVVGNPPRFLSFGDPSLAIGDLNVITAFLFIILLGLGIDFGIHIFARYRAERLRQKPIEEALALTLRYTGRACMTSALTTSAAFLPIFL